MNLPGKIELILNLLQSGLLCNCKVYEPVCDEDGNIVGEEFQHEKNCIGQAKASELLKITIGDVNG